ncbi:MAG: hypothetical protein HQK65_20505, partial [Desulfamplus sp.]|nr:hypothetical protein [Desulfamplus sp.]
AFLPMPIVFSGGFFLRTHVANILFEPGSGTISGLHNMGIDFREETDIIIVSHHHPQSRIDLHNIFNMLGGFTPERVKNAKDNKKQAFFFSTEAVINGRNGHHSILMPSDYNVINGNPFITTPWKAWEIRRESEAILVKESKEWDIEPDQNSIVIKTLPAYHSEATPRNEDFDSEGKNGTQMSCFLIKSSEWGILFTGDTEYPFERWKETVDDNKKKRVTELVGKLDLLIANTKTIEYLKKENDNPQKNNQEENKWYNLSLTERQLGFEGTRCLTLDLKPKALVIRALGLECVMKGSSKYAPENLCLLQEVMEHALKEGGLNKTKVVIPGRHEVLIKKVDSNIVVEDAAVIPAFTRSRYKFGDRFVTANPKLAKNIEYYIELMKRSDRPFMVIQGESGSGKTLLAQSIGKEISFKTGVLRLSSEIFFDLDENKIRGDRKSIETLSKKAYGKTEWKKKGIPEKYLKEIRAVDHFDLATFAKDSETSNQLLLGYPSVYSVGKEAVSCSEGLLGQLGTTIIFNQLEKLPLSESVKFLDLIQEWSYRPHEGKGSLPVRVKIIFTTNIDLDNPEMAKHLSPDMINRLHGRLLTIPSLYSLSREAREREVKLFIREWCNNNNVVLENAAFQKLQNVDLRNGIFRCLNGILETSKTMVEIEYRTYDQNGDTKPLIYIPEEFVKKAMEATEVIELKNLEPESFEGEGIQEGLAWIISIWISFSCNNQETYSIMIGDKGGTLGSRKFNDILEKFHSKFKSKSIDSCWEFFTSEEAMKSLEKTDGTFEKYISSLFIIKEKIELCKLFRLESKDGKPFLDLTAQYEKLKNNLKYQYKKEELKKEFLNKIRKG